VIWRCREAARRGDGKFTLAPVLNSDVDIQKGLDTVGGGFWEIASKNDRSIVSSLPSPAAQALLGNAMFNAITASDSVQTAAYAARGGGGVNTLGKEGRCRSIRTVVRFILSST